MNIHHVSPPSSMSGFKLPGAQIRGLGWKLVNAANGTMRVRVNFDACKLQFLLQFPKSSTILALIERKDEKENIVKDGDFVRVSAEFLEELRESVDILRDHFEKYEVARDGKIIEKYNFSELVLNSEIDSFDTRMIIQEASGMNDDTEEEFPEVLANDGYKWIVAESSYKNQSLADTARGANRPQVVWWDETLGTEAAFWVDDDLTLCAKGTGYRIQIFIRN